MKMKHLLLVHFPSNISAKYHHNWSLIDCVKSFTSHQTQNRSFWRRSSQTISWLGTEKLDRTQQKQTCICNEIYYNTK